MISLEHFINSTSFLHFWQRTCIALRNHVDNELLRDLTRHFEAFQIGRPTPLQTPASLGESSLFELQESGSFQQLNGIPGEPSVLDQQQRLRLASLSNEHQVVAFLTPVFEQVLGENLGIQVVNSEEYPWLVTRSDNTRYNQKPDNIFCHNAIYSTRGAFETEDPTLLELRRARDKFGVLTNWRLRDCIDATGEAKVRIDNAAFGEVVNYARHICYAEKAPDRTKFVLYDKSQFWLISAVKGVISLVQTCGWCVPGSRQILKDFIYCGRSPWMKLLNSVCHKWALTVSSDSFLGMGTFGRVFKVRLQPEGGGRHEFMALKLVLPGEQGTGPLELLKEKECMESATCAVPDVVVEVARFFDFGGGGAALLLRQVGGVVPKTARAQIFKTLGMLHEQNIVHGDPRLANAVYFQGSVRWIDFRASAVLTNPDTIGLKRRDMTTLVKSCCHEQGTPFAALEQVVQQYDGTPTSAHMVYESLLNARS